MKQTKKNKEETDNKVKKRRQRLDQNLLFTKIQPYKTSLLPYLKKKNELAAKKKKTDKNK